MSHISSHLTNNVDGSDVYCQWINVKKGVFQEFGNKHYCTSMRSFIIAV